MAMDKVSTLKTSHFRSIGHMHAVLRAEGPELDLINDQLIDISENLNLNIILQLLQEQMAPRYILSVTLPSAIHTSRQSTVADATEFI